MLKKRLSYNARLIVVLAAAILSLAPVVFVFTNSFMGTLEAGARYTSIITPHSSLGVVSGGLHYMDMTFLPDLLSLDAWRQVLTGDPASLRFMWNSLMLAIPIVLGNLIIAPMAAYGFERARHKHKEKLYFAYIIIMLLPMQALLVPHFIAAGMLGIRENYLAIILPAIVAPFGVFLIRQQMKTFRKELIEAAKIDGANELTIFIRIVLPNIKPAMSALAVLAFAEAWNVVDQAVVFIRDPWAMPLSVYLSAGLEGNIGVVFALSSLFMIPPLILFVYGQDGLSEYAG